MQIAQSVKYIVLSVFVLILILTVWAYWPRQFDTSKYKNYHTATATIERKVAGHIGRHGVKPNTVDLKFTTANGQIIEVQHVVISKELQIGDTLTIYYNPTQPSVDLQTQRNL